MNSLFLTRPKTKARHMAAVSEHKLDLSELSSPDADAANPDLLSPHALRRVAAQHLKVLVPPEVLSVADVAKQGINAMLMAMDAVDDMGNGEDKRYAVLDSLFEQYRAMAHVDLPKTRIELLRANPKLIDVLVSAKHGKLHVQTSTSGTFDPDTFDEVLFIRRSLETLTGEGYRRTAALESIGRIMELVEELGIRDGTRKRALASRLLTRMLVPRDYIEDSEPVKKLTLMLGLSAIDAIASLTHGAVGERTDSLHLGVGASGDAPTDVLPPRGGTGVDEVVAEIATATAVAAIASTGCCGLLSKRSRRRRRRR